MSQERKTILVGIEKEAMNQFRKTLFEKGLNPNEFFSYIVDLVNINDERVLDFLQEIKKIKINKLMRGEADNFTPDNLYDAIEEKLKK